MKNIKYKAVLIGCGKIGVEEGNYRKEVQPATHASAYKSHPRIELAGLADISEERLKVANRYFPDVPLFNSAEKMLKNIRPDIVSIATQSDSHLKLVKLAAKYKTRAIVCEKPISNSLKEAEKMIKTCRDNKSLLIINHQRRFDSLIQKWQKKVKGGLIGNILQASCFYYNGLFNNGTHMVDLLRFFLGEVSWAKAIINEKTSWNKKDKNVDAILGFKNGARAVLQSLSKNYGFFTFYFYGNRGRVFIKNLPYEIEYRELIRSKDYKNFYQLSEPIKKERKKNSFMKSMVNHVVDCLDGKTKPASRGEDGLAALKVLLALKESAENNGKFIKL